MLKYPSCIVLTLAVLGLPSWIIAQSQKTDVPAKIDSPIKHDFANEAAVIESFKNEVTFENDGTGARTQEAHLRVQSDAGVKRFGLLQFGYESQIESLNIDYVRVHKADGTVVATPVENIQDMASAITREAPLYSDLREKHVAVRGLSPGDELEYLVHWKVTKPLAPGQFWYDYNFSTDAIVLDEQLQIRVPHGRAIKMKSPDVKPALRQEGGYDVYTWSRPNLEVKPDDEKTQRGKLILQARGRAAGPDVRFSSFQSWEEIGRWYDSLQSDRVKPGAEIQAKAAELTKGMTDDSAKLHAIYDYVSMEFRYIGVDFGIGRYQPHSASDVLDNQYGDCKDKHTLLASLLQAAGIKSYAALISHAHEIDPDVPTPSQFDHVITAVPQGQGYLWLDTTAEVAPFGYLLQALRDKHALLIADGKPILVSTPTTAPASKVTFEIDAKLDDSGTLEGKIDRSVQGDDAEVILRSAFRSIGMPQWKDLVQRISYASGFGGDVSDVSASAPEKTSAPFDYSYSYTRKGYPDWSEHHITSPVPPLELPEPDEENGKLVHPIWLGPSSEIHLLSHVKLPGGYSPQLPDAVDVKTDFADYHTSYSYKDGVLITDRTLHLKLPEVPATELEAYKSLRKRTQDDWGVYIELSSGSESLQDSMVKSIRDPILALPDSKNAQAIKAEENSRAAMRSNDMEGAIDYLKDAVAADPAFTRAWMMLGSLEMTLRHRDEGMAAFRKAAESAPKEVSPLKMLGFGFMEEKEYAKAVEAWQNAEKLAPEDSDIPFNLGSAFTELKRYSEAATAYEDVVKLRPGQTRAFIAMGRAYLLGGNDDKAAAAFEKAFAIDSGPEPLNDIAYELAEANKKLDLSEKYAEQAVRQEEEASQKVKVADLRRADLQPTQKLGAYWDTLGWVYFRMNKPESAERYLRAAWVLSQNPVVGGHLAQVYESQGKKILALHTFRLALVASGGKLPDEDLATVNQHIERLSKKGPVAPSERYVGVDELNRMRTLKLPRLVPGSASAEVLLLIGREGKVEDLKMIGGDGRLKSAEKKLASARFDAPFPDDSPTQLLRRGILGCYPVTGCSLVLYTPDMVHSVE